MIYKQPSIYKSGLTLKDVSKSITSWEDVTNEFSIKNSNLFFNGGTISKNETLKELKFSIRIDLKNAENIPSNGRKSFNDIMEHPYVLVPGSTSFNGVYIGNYEPSGYNMMWNDVSTLNIQIYNPTPYTSLLGFVINGIVLYE